MALVQKSFSDIITFSRSSNATRVGPTGLVEYAPHNLLTYSEQFDNAAWAAASVAGSVTANATTSPNGTVSADLYVPNTSSSDVHRVIQQLTTSSGIFSVSVYIKSAGYSRAFIFVNGPNQSAVFNLSDQTVTADTRFAAAPSNMTITSVGNGWYRCSFTTNISASISYVQVHALNSTANPGDYYSGDGTSGIYLWGAQLAVGPYALDYTPTTSAAVYGPRFDYDPVTLAARGLLVEEQRTNLVTWSEDFSNGSWIKGLATISANSGTAPDGTQTADKLIPTAVSSSDHGVYQITAASGVGVYTVSAFVKAAGYNFADIFDGYGSALLTVDLTNGSYSVVGSPTATSVTAFGNGWYRVTITRTVSGVPAYIQIRAQNDINRTAFTGDGTSGIYVWGAQAEQASFATSYIPTIGTVTRSADLANVDTLTPWMNQTEGTIFAEYSFYGADAAYNNTAVMLTDGTENNYETIFGYNPAYGWVQSGGATSAGLSSGGSTTINTNYKAALAFKANDFAFSLNGGAAVTDTSGSVPTVTQMLLGRRVSNSKPLHGYLRRVAFFPRRLSNAEIQALTA